jgi:hypothetical protein
MKYLAIALVVVGCTGRLDPTGENQQPDASPTTGDGATIDAPGGGGGAGQLQITATSSTANGQYAPSNVLAIWIEGPGGTFVKTVGRWANARKQHLVAWTTAAGATDADAVSGATRQNHATAATATWNLLNKQGQVIPDGTYTVRMESTEINATTAGQNNQGTFTFVKSGTAQMQTNLSNGGFSAVSLTFTP